MQNTVVQYKIQYYYTKYSNPMQNTVFAMRNTVLHCETQHCNAKYSISMQNTVHIPMQNTVPLQCKIHYCIAKYSSTIKVLNTALLPLDLFEKKYFMYCMAFAIYFRLKNSEF